MEGRNELNEMLKEYEDRLIEMFEEGIKKYKGLEIFEKDWIQVSVEIRYHLWKKVHLIYSYNKYPRNPEDPLVKIYQYGFYENPTQISKLNSPEIIPLGYLSQHYKKIICQYGDKILEKFNTEFEKKMKEEIKEENKASKKREKEEIKEENKASKKREKEEKKRIKEEKEAEKHYKICVENLKKYLN